MPAVTSVSIIFKEIFLASLEWVPAYASGTWLGPSRQRMQVVIGEDKFSGITLGSVLSLRQYTHFKNVKAKKNFLLARNGLQML
jgi:hypothetical protein